MKPQNNIRTELTYPSNDFSPCVRCGGQIICESWCESVNSSVRYAHDAVLHPTYLSFGDRIILHALGVRWTPGRNRTKHTKTG